MICSSCRRTLLLRLPSFSNHVRLNPSTTRTYATTPRTSNAAPIQPPPAPLETADNTAPAISPATPEISLPPTPHLSPISAANPSSTSNSKTRKHAPSSVPGGAELKGLAYLKAKPSIVAKEDEEYPDWLWGILDDPKSKSGPAGSAVDLNAMTKKQRGKYDRKQSKLMKDTPQVIPLHEQSQDLTKPGDDAITSLERRSEVVKSSRVARRKGIREANFLRGM